LELMNVVGLDTLEAAVGAYRKSRELPAPPAPEANGA